MAASISYYPSRNRKKTLRITILPNNWIGIFTPKDMTWLRSNVMNITGIKYNFTLLKSRCIVDFPSAETLDAFMKSYRKDFINAPN